MAAGILREDQNYHDITRVFTQGKGVKYLLSIIPKLNSTEIKRVEADNLIKGTVVYSTLFAPNGFNVTTTDAEHDELTFRRNNGTLSINGAKVTIADILVANGVMHAALR